MADGVSYSSAVSANAPCVLDTTSKPSRFNASPRRFAKYTLLSMRSTLTGRPAGITVVPPHLVLLHLPRLLVLDLACAYRDSTPPSHHRHATTNARRSARPMSPASS